MRCKRKKKKLNEIQGNVYNLGQPLYVDFGEFDALLPPIRKFGKVQQIDLESIIPPTALDVRIM